MNGRIRRATPVLMVFFAAVFSAAAATCVCAQSLNIGDDSVTIGLNVPLSGSYALQGKDEERAYKLAIDTVNSQGGVLGRQLAYVLKDTEISADTAGKNARELIRHHNAVMVTGGSSSAVAIAQSDVCQEQKRIFMAALTHSNATTGFMTTPSGLWVQKAHRHTFRWYFNAWMTAKALIPFLTEEFGKGRSYYYITADYTWGHSVEESLKLGLELSENDTSGVRRTPLGKSDFKLDLKRAGEADPDVLVLVLFGNDMITALRQAEQMGLKRKMEIVVPLMELNMAHAVGPKVMADVYCTVNWYWGLRDRFAGSKRFVAAFLEQYGRPPGSAAAAAWVAVHEWADAVERAGTFQSGPVIQALENHEFKLLKDREVWRGWDHQAVSSVFVARGKRPGASKGEWDLLEIVREVPGEKVMMSRENNPVTLERIEQ